MFQIQTTITSLPVLYVDQQSGRLDRDTSLSDKSALSVESSLCHVISESLLAPCYEYVVLVLGKSLVNLERMCGVTRY